MTITGRDLDILRLLRRFFYLRTSQIRDRIAPHDKDGSIVRSRLRKLMEPLAYIKRYQPKMVDPTTGNGTASPIFTITSKGSCILAHMTNDVSQILAIEPTFANWMSMNHYALLAWLHMLIDDAIAAQDYVKQHALYFEHELLEVTEAAKKYRLQTVVSQSPLIFCCPDSAMEIEVKSYRRALFVEYETGSDVPGRVCAKKHKGYAGLAASGLFRRHFPQARDFRVLCFCPGSSWMHAIRKEFKGKPGAEHWLFADSGSLTKENFLHGELFWDVAGQQPIPLVKRPSGC